MRFLASDGTCLGALVRGPGARSSRIGPAPRERALLSFALCGLLAVIAPSAAHAANIASNQTGNWDATSTWVGAVIPVAARDEVPPNGHRDPRSGTPGHR